MRSPTAQQLAVLDNTARVRVVRAVPGSGKTWLVAELIRRELTSWHSGAFGIAALSFTRVGGEEITRAVGHELAHPHFVGTIDAFLFRYVIRPFLQKCFLRVSAPRLIPADWGAGHWAKCGRFKSTNVASGVNLFGCVFIGEGDGEAVIAHKPHPAQPLRQISDDKQVQDIKRAKRELWRVSGCLTHSDAALLASKILEHKEFGVVVRAEIVRRFPLIIVDELQDTGYFLGKAIRRLICDSSVRAVLVGDPDQAIFEFNGARPDLFDKFEIIQGTEVLALSKTLRCPPSVAKVASHLKDSGGSITADCGKTGQAFLLRYTDLAADVPRVIGIITRTRKDASTKVIARQTSTIQALIERNAKSLPKLGCRPLSHMCRAVTLFRQGRQVAALAAACAAIDLAIFHHEGVDAAELQEHGIDSTCRKRLAVECLLSANAKAIDGSLYDWQMEAGKVLDQKISEFCLKRSLQFAPGGLRPQKRRYWDCVCADYLPQICACATMDTNVPVSTVHGVKGETHDITVFVCPDTKASHCPSTTWWSIEEKNREEKRIAYVAMTRTRGDLIVCVSEACYKRLCKSQRTFVDRFICMSVGEYVKMLSPGCLEGVDVASTD